MREDEENDDEESSIGQEGEDEIARDYPVHDRFA